MKLSRSIHVRQMAIFHPFSMDEFHRKTVIFWCRPETMVQNSIISGLSEFKGLNSYLVMIHTVFLIIKYQSVQFSSVAQSCPTLCDSMNCSTPGLPDNHQLPEFTQTHIHWVSDAIQPSHPLSSPSPPTSNPSQHQSLFLWVNSSHEVAKVLEFQL